MTEPNKKKDDGFFWRLMIPMICTGAVGALFFFGQYLGFTQGAEKASKAAEDYFHADAIKQGFAQYDATTGKWRWKEQGELVFLKVIETEEVDLTTPVNLPTKRPRK